MAEMQEMGDTACMGSMGEQKGKPPLWDSSIRHFLEMAWSGQPTPGGGSVAAVAAAARSAYLTVMINLPAVEADKRLRYHAGASPGAAERS